jgi:hypothetical protein
MRITIDFAKVETSPKPPQDKERLLIWSNSPPFESELWKSADGIVWYISELNVRHARNIQNMLLARARGLQIAVVEWYEVIMY